MQLNTFTDYGLRTLIYLATLPEGELSSITAVSDTYNVSRNHMMKIVSKLGQCGYIETVRGKHGGIRLKQPAQQIVIGDVVRSLEPLQLLDCSIESCHITPACRLKDAVQIATKAFVGVLDQYTLEDVVKDNEPLYQLLQPVPA